MSKKKVGKKLLSDIIKNVLETSEDIRPNRNFIHEIASRTLSSTPVVEIISGMGETDNLPEDRTEEIRLTSCIEVLAIVTNMIDHYASEQNLN